MDKRGDSTLIKIEGADSYKTYIRRRIKIYLPGKGLI
jgi:hypothetical protein